MLKFLINLKSVIVFLILIMATFVYLGILGICALFDKESTKFVSHKIFLERKEDK